MIVLKVIGLMAAGGLITSYVELKLQYNLVDIILDKVKPILAKIKALFK